MYGLLPTITIDMRDVCSKSSAFPTIKALPFPINAQIKLSINDDDMFDYPFMGRRFAYCTVPSESRSVQSRVVDHKETVK